MFLGKVSGKLFLKKYDNGFSQKSIDLACCYIHTFTKDSMLSCRLQVVQNMTFVDSKEDRRCINVIEKWKSQNRVSKIAHILQRITILLAIREYIHNNGSFYNGS